KVFAVVEAKHLLVKVSVKMKRLHAHIRCRNAALEERPEILKAVSVYATIHVLRGMVNNLVRVIGCQSIIGHERIGVESRASSDVLAYFILQYGLATVGNNGSANLSATFQDADNGSLILW